MAQGPSATQADLIRRAQAGEPQALQRLAREYSECLIRAAMALCRDRQLAEDLAQETLFEAWRSIGRFDGRCQYSTWLLGILRHRFLKARRRDSRRVLAHPAIDEGSLVTMSGQDASGDSQRAEDARAVRRAVAALPERHRLVIELRFFGDASLDDIAAALDIPLGTVKSRLHNALEQLRQQSLTVNLFERPGESPVRQP